MDDVQQKVKEIKQSFRLMMDGSVAQSMRQKGMGYRLSWGVTTPRLRQTADELLHEMNTEGGGHTHERPYNEAEDGGGNPYALAIALWKEDVRECKILATMLMPPQQMLPEVADLWMEQTPTVEVAEQVAFNLYQHMPAAADMAFRWIASPRELTQLCGYHVLSRLFQRRQEPNERAINEFIDQALCALQSTDAPLRKAAMQAVLHFASMGLLYERLSRSAIHTINLDFV